MILQEIVDYLVENGVDENEVDHLVRQKYFAGRSILDFVREDQKNDAWNAAESWITGETFTLMYPE